MIIKPLKIIDLDIRQSDVLIADLPCIRVKDENADIVGLNFWSKKFHELIKNFGFCPMWDLMHRSSVLNGNLKTQIYDEDIDDLFCIASSCKQVSLFCLPEEVNQVENFFGQLTSSIRLIK